MKNGYPIGHEEKVPPDLKYKCITLTPPAAAGGFFNPCVKDRQ